MILKQGTASDYNENYEIDKTRKNILNSTRF